MANNVIIETETKGLKETLQRIMSTNPRMERALRSVIREQIMKAAVRTRKDIKPKVGIGYPNSAGDPRQAYRAVKAVAWKLDFGGAISLYDKTKASNQRVNVERRRKLDLNPTQRGGNRRAREYSQKVDSLNSYFGSDRAFILRWLNDGTNHRVTMPHSNKSGDVTRLRGNRGRIGGIGFWDTVSFWNIQAAGEEVMRQVMELAAEMFEGR